MKVIVEGKSGGWSKRFKCTGRGNGDGGCGALLEVTESDLIHTQSHARDETTDYATFECCSCGKWTDAGSDDRRSAVPRSVWDYVMSRPTRTLYGRTVDLR